MSLKSKLTQKRPSNGQSCSTRGWAQKCEWDKKIERAIKANPGLNVLIAKVVALHLRKMPATLRDGQCLTTELDSEAFSDNVYLMTSCGPGPTWERPRSGSSKLWSLIAYPSSF